MTGKNKFVEKVEKTEPRRCEICGRIINRYSGIKKYCTVCGHNVNRRGHDAVKISKNLFKLPKPQKEPYKGKFPYYDAQTFKN